MVLFEGHVSLKSWPSSRYDLKNQYHHNCIRFHTQSRRNQPWEIPKAIEPRRWFLELWKLQSIFPLTMKQSWSEMQDTKPMKIESVPTRSLLLFKLSRMNQGTLGHLQVALLLGFCRQDRTELRCVLHPTPLRMDMEKRTFFNAPVKYSEIPRVVLFKCSGFIYYLSPGFWRGTLSVLLRREERL